MEAAKLPISRLIAALTLVIDLAVPASTRAEGGVSLQRGRMIVSATAFSAGFWLISGVAQLAFEGPGLSNAIALTGAALAFAWLASAPRLRLPGDPALPLVVLMVSQVALQWFCTGMTNPTMAFALAAIPGAAMLVGGWRIALGMTAVSLAAFVLSLWPPLGVALRPLANGPAVPVEFIYESISMTLVIGLFSILVDWTRQSAVGRVVAAEKRARQNERRARQALEQQSAVAHVTRRVQTAERESVPDAIREGLETLGELTGAKTVALILLDFKTNEAVGFHRWTCSDPREMYVVEPSDLAERCPWAAAQLAERRLVVISARDRLPPEAEAERELMELRGIQASAILPIRQDHAQGGFLSVEISKPRDWNEHEIRTIQIIGDVLASAHMEAAAESARLESEERFAAAFAAHPSALVLLGTEPGEILECNDRFQHMLGRERGQILGHTAAELPLPLALEGHDAGLLVRACSEEVELMLPRTPGDSPTAWAVSAIPVTIRERSCLLVTMRDIAHQKELETRLVQSQKLDAMGRLAGGIAHDFNNMLTVIRGYVDVLGDKLGDAHQDELDVIREATARSSDLTRQLLGFSRHQATRPVPVDLNDLVARLDPMLRRLLGADIRVSTRLDPAPSVVVLDRSLAELAIVNLAVNARDAIQDGGSLRLSVTVCKLKTEDAAEIDLPPGAYVRLDVSDDGSGMGPELLERVVEPFFSTKEEGLGTGLGLSMVDGFARQTGGAMSLSSSVGSGTTVTLHLPRTEQTAEVVQDDRHTGPEVRTARILLVEDEAPLRRLARRTLEAAGHHVVDAGNGVEALDRLRSLESPPELVVTDAVMPLMGGGELIGRLRMDLPSLPAIVTSGYSDDPKLGALASAFLSKPFTQTQLADCVARVLSEHDAHESSSGES